MLRAFSAFLSVFFVVSLVVRAVEMAYLIGAGAVALFAIDLLAHRFDGRPHRFKMSRDLLL